MEFSYNKLWKLLIDKNMRSEEHMSELQSRRGISFGVVVV